MTIRDIYQIEGMAVLGGFDWFVGHPDLEIPSKPKEEVHRAAGAYCKWFHSHKDWFSDKLDYEAMESIVHLIQAHASTSIVRDLLVKEGLVIRNVKNKADIPNWYVKYAMFDPTMGMYDPDEAENYFRQRMVKRFNTLSHFFETRVERKAKKMRLNSS